MNSFSPKVPQYNPNIFAELWQFLRARKRVWLIPIVFALVLLGFLIMVSSSTAILSPFLYAM